MTYIPLIERIQRDGVAYPGNILKVDSFLNHQIDVLFMQELAEEIHHRYATEKITKILTIESSGIAVSCFVAALFRVPVVFAKKNQSAQMSPTVFSVPVDSFTHKKTFNVVVSKSFLSSNDSVLIVDDFLAEGKALSGLITICKEAQANVVGAAIVIEKGFQNGGSMVRSMGLRVESLAIIDSLEDGIISCRTE